MASSSKRLAIFLTTEIKRKSRIDLVFFLRPCYAVCTLSLTITFKLETEEFP